MSTDAVQQAQRLQRVVAAGVVDQRHPQPALDGAGQGGQDLGHVDGGRDEVDVVAAQVLELQHRPRQLLVRHRPAPAGLRYLPVLAVDAGQVAGREEDGARPAGAHQRRLLAEVGAKDEITARAPMRQKPRWSSARRSTLHPRGQTRQGLAISSQAASTRRRSSSGDRYRYDGLWRAALLINFSIATARGTAGPGAPVGQARPWSHMSGMATLELLPGRPLWRSQVAQAGPGQTTAEGQRGASGHWGHSGRCALQMRRPCLMRLMWKG